MDKKNIDTLSTSLKDNVSAMPDHYIILSVLLTGTHLLPSSLGRLPTPLDPAVEPSRSEDVDGVASTCHQCAVIPPRALCSSDDDTECTQTLNTSQVHGSN